jgi:multicomponent Na+:H+ antiporter subunit D
VLPVLPIVIPLASATLGLLLRHSPAAQRLISVLGCVALLLASLALFGQVWVGGIAVSHLGNWPAPFGITLAVDVLGALMVVITAVTGLVICVYSLGSISERRERGGYYTGFHVLLMGVNGSFVTGDLFNLYVWFEVLLIASFALLVMGSDRAQLRGGLQYVLINLVASSVLLIAIALLYGLTGTLNMADAAVRLAQVSRPGLVTTVAMLFMVAFGIKAAAFPLFFWLPVSYHTPPIAVSALFAGLLTKVGVYALIRVFTLLFVHDVGYTHGILLAVAGFTMLSGVLGAAAQTDIRKILGFHSISQVGYMLMGLALYTKLALVGAICFILHHNIVKANLFLVGGVTQLYTGSFDLKQVGGVYRERPLLALWFLIPAFSLAGFPPLSGFWAKLFVIKAGLDDGAYVIALVALVTSALTLFSMTKIWTQAFWKPHPDGGLPEADGTSQRLGLLLAPIITLAILTVLIGLQPEVIYRIADYSAGQLLDRNVYIEAVGLAGPLAGGQP